MSEVVARYSSDGMGAILIGVATAGLWYGRIGYLAAGVLCGVGLVLLGYLRAIEAGPISFDVDDR